jgi:hypothetical protein
MLLRILEGVDHIILLEGSSLLLVSVLAFIEFVIRLGGAIGEQVSACFYDLPLVEHEVLV